MPSMPLNYAEKSGLFHSLLLPKNAKKQLNGIQTENYKNARRYLEKPKNVPYGQQIIKQIATNLEAVYLYYPNKFPIIYLQKNLYDF